MGLTQCELADGIRVPYQRVNELVNGRRGITPATALRLAKFFGTTPDLWMNSQLRWDLYHAQVAEAQDLDRLDRLVDGGHFPNRSQAIEVAVTEKLDRLERQGLGEECAKLDPAAEQALGDEGLGADVRRPDGVLCWS